MTPRYSQFKPSGPVQVDWGHQLAKGLKFDAIFNEGGGLIVRDFANVGLGVGQSSPGWHPRGTDIAGSSYWEYSNVTDEGLLSQITLIWRGNIRSGGAFRQFMGKHAGNGANNCPFDYRTDNSGTPLLTLVRSDAGGTATKTGPAVTLNQYKTYAVSDPRGNTAIDVKFAIDGFVASTVGADSLPVTGSGAPIRVGRRADGAVQMDGICEYARVYTRALSSDELMWSHIEPYAHLVPIVRRSYFIPAPPAAITGAGASTIAPFVCAATGTLEMSGSAAATIGPFVCAATGTLEMSGAGASTIGAFTCTATGTIALSGACASTIGPFVCSATGTTSGDFDGVGASLIGPFLCTATGTITIPPPLDFRASVALVPIMRATAELTPIMRAEVSL